MVDCKEETSEPWNYLKLNYFIIPGAPKNNPDKIILQKLAKYGVGKIVTETVDEYRDANL